MEIKSKKIAFFGTPPFTVDFLELLKNNDYTPELIITNPDRPSGRGMVLTSPEPKNWATENNISVLQPEKLDQEFFEKLSLEDWDLFVVVAYGKIIPEEIINLPKFGTINVHYSLLPKYRGATPVESAILNGDNITGVSIQQMRYKLDTGEILATKEISIESTDTTPTLREKLNNEALALLPETLNNIFDQKITPFEQNDSLSSHCKKITKNDGLINLSDDPILNDRKYRAYYGSIGTYFFMEKDGNKVRAKITKAHLENDKFIIDEIIPENGKRMAYKS